MWRYAGADSGGRAQGPLLLPAIGSPADVAAERVAAALNKKTKYVKPVYPKAALDARVHGEVLLEIVIGTDGRAADARILKSVPQLDQAAIEATLAARYEPVQVNGLPVRVVSIVPTTSRSQPRRSDWSLVISDWKGGASSVRLGILVTYIVSS